MEKAISEQSQELDSKSVVNLETQKEKLIKDIVIHFPRSEYEAKLKADPSWYPRISSAETMQWEKADKNLDRAKTRLNTAKELGRSTIRQERLLAKRQAEYDYVVAAYKYVR